MSYEATQSFIQEEVVSFSIARRRCCVAARDAQYLESFSSSLRSVVFQTMTIEV